jgi:orotidine-5'-phosphate decarboxylase
MQLRTGPNAMNHNPVYLAVDLPRLDAAEALARQVAGHVGGLKLGMEFFYAHGHHGVLEMAKIGLPIFLDVKLHDIPNTVAAAMQAIHVLQPAIVTVHAAGGRAMMEDAKAAAGEKTKVVAVTVLTSLDEDDLRDIGVNAEPHEQALRLAELAHSAGLDGIVCSGHEVGPVHKQWRDGFLVVPGLRPKAANGSGAAGDQKRIVTPREARDSGASVLVVGRPISRAEDPLAAARAIESTL